MDETIENKDTNDPELHDSNNEGEIPSSDINSKTPMVENNLEDAKEDGGKQIVISNDANILNSNKSTDVKSNSNIILKTTNIVLTTCDDVNSTEESDNIEQVIKTECAPQKNESNNINNSNRSCGKGTLNENINSSNKDNSNDSNNEAPNNLNEHSDTTGNYDPKDVEYIGNVAVYTDPESGCKFKWDNEKNEWVTYTDVTYTFEDDTHVYTSSDGSKYFWDKEKNAWFPKIDEDFMVQYQLNYGFTTESQNKPDEPEKTAEVAKPPPKPLEKGVKRKPSEPTWFEPDDKQNTKVYVSNLPQDITEEEFTEVMQKCGIIMRDPGNNKLKIKLYADSESKTLKGDGLCTYIRIESVDLAIRLLDGYDVRGNKIHVERAKFQMRGNYDPKLKPKTKRRKDKDKLKKMQEKLFDWRPEKQRGERSKHERIVIIKNMFEPKLFDEDVGLILEFRKDLTEECTKCGEVRKVTIFDRHPEGIAQVNMADPEAADACVVLLNGRWFGKRQLIAHIWDGRTKYRIAETDSQISQRLDNWDKFLTEDEGKKTEEVAK